MQLWMGLWLHQTQCSSRPTFSCLPPPHDLRSCCRCSRKLAHPRSRHLPPEPESSCASCLSLLPTTRSCISHNGSSCTSSPPSRHTQCASVPSFDLTAKSMATGALWGCSTLLNQIDAKTRLSTLTKWRLCCTRLHSLRAASRATAVALRQLRGAHSFGNESGRLAALPLSCRLRGHCTSAQLVSSINAS